MGSKKNNNENFFKDRSKVIQDIEFKRPKPQIYILYDYIDGEEFFKGTESEVKEHLFEMFLSKKEVGGYKLSTEEDYNNNPIFKNSKDE
jgi:hypothetical protein